MKKLILFLTVLFSVSLILAADFEPGVAAGAILNSPAVVQLMGIGRGFILLIFSVILAKNMFKIVTGQGQPDWFGLLAKFAIIFILYNNATWAVTSFTNNIIVATVTDDSTRVSQAFSKLDVAVMTLAMGDPEDLQKLKEKNRADSVLPDAVTDTFTELNRIFSFQMIMSMIMSIVIKGLLTISLMTKYLMIDIFWPIFFQLVVIGFVFAVPFASFDGGMDSIKKFGINMVEVAMWPVIYNLAFGLTIDSMTDVIYSFVSTIGAPYDNSLDPGMYTAVASAKVLANIPLLANLIAYLVFLIGLGFLTPLFSRMIVRNESVGIAASALTYSTGSQLMSMATSAGGMAGNALASAGKGMMGMTSKGASEAAKGAGGAAGNALSSGASGGGSGASGGSGGSSGSSGSSGNSVSSGSSETAGGGSGGGTGSGDTGSGGSKITGDLAGSGGRAAHGGKGFYNAPNLSKGENQALSKLSGNADAKSEFGKLQGMRKDGYNQNAINNQIESINKKFGTDLPKEKE